MHLSDYYINRTFSTTDTKSSDVSDIIPESPLDILASEVTAKIRNLWWLLPSNNNNNNNYSDVNNNNFNTTTTTDTYLHTHNNRTKIFFYNSNNNDSIAAATTTIYLSSDTLNNYWALLALLLVVCTAAGNILVCLAITWERRLQNVTNYFLMSLAITDLMVAILVMPLGILTLVKGE